MPVRQDRGADLKIVIKMEGGFTQIDPRDLAVEVEIDRQPCTLTVEEYVLMAAALEEAKQRIREFIT